MNKEERSIVNKVEFSDGHYQITIPWKENHLHLSNNYKMALQRLQGLEKRLLKSPSTAVPSTMLFIRDLSSKRICLMYCYGLDNILLL